MPMHIRLAPAASAPSCRDGGLLRPRVIRFASEIPALGLRGFDREPRAVRLRGVVDEPTAAFVGANGAARQGPFWVVRRRDPFPFDLGEHLPRMAQRSLTPEIVEAEPPGDWRASLESFCDPRWWRRLVADVWRSERVCRECGAVPFRPDRLEGHEVWVEHASSGGAVRRLVDVRVLCPACMEMRCPARAERMGRGARAFDRLCAANRIAPGEREAFRAAIDARSSSAPWHAPVVEVDLSWLGGRAVVTGRGVRREDGLLVHDSLPGAILLRA